jgi:SAM-dependent methyltransferase
VIANPTYQERYEFSYEHFNVERETFPYPEQTFNVVLFCEILEHLLIDPSAALSEIHRVLRPGGYLLVTTPNVLACQNVLKLAVGQNIYDRYSGYGIYGRHNREYTPQEVMELLQSCGFDIMTVRVEDIHPHTTLIVRLLKGLRQQWRDNIFILARASGVINSAYPASLYRSMRTPSGRSL